MRAVRQVVLVAVLAACFVSTLPQAEAASWTDRIFSGFLSFGRAFSNATQVVVARVKVLVNPSSANKNQEVKDMDIFASVCSLSGSNRRLLIKCLRDNDEELLKPDWQNCIGSAKIEVLTVEDLYHWACSRLSSTEELQEFRNTSQCLLEGMHKATIAAAIKDCKGSSRPY
ncbi:unnamed protein product [Ixodes hexagonus]